MHHLIVTADDFGLSKETNRGILDAHLHGIVTSASLLMNAPETEEAIALSKIHPSLEIGIHLGLVEGFSLINQRSSITDELSYFPGQVCLHRHWRPFIKSYLAKSLDLNEIRAELEAQCLAFKAAFPDRPDIPFANGTQHLHLLPQIAPIVVDLCHRFRIRFLRAPRGNGGWKRLPFGLLLAFLGARLRRQNPIFPKFTDDFLGFDASGQIDLAYLRKSFKQIQETKNSTSQIFELMTHPGFEATHLRKNLPWAYSEFDWEGEHKALTDPDILALLKEFKINLTQFRKLPHAD